MDSIIMKKPHLQTEMEIWQPKYSAQYKEGGEWIVLLHKRKVDFGTPVIRIKFTKAKHLQGQRFAMYRKDIMQYPVGTNGKAEMYEVPFDKLCTWESVDEVKATVDKLFFNKET